MILKIEIRDQEEEFAVKLANTRNPVWITDGQGNDCLVTNIEFEE